MSLNRHEKKFLAQGAGIVILVFFLAIGINAGVAWIITEILDWAIGFEGKQWKICFAISFVLLTFFRRARGK